MSESREETMLTLGALALPALVVISIGVRRRSGFLLAVGGFMLGRAARLTSRDGSPQ